MIFEHDPNTEPCYVISIAARMVGLHAQTLRYYERVGLLSPSRSLGRQRLYSPTDVARLRRIKALTDEMGVNLAGAEVVLGLMEHINDMQKEIDHLRGEMKRLESASYQDDQPTERRDK